MNLKIAIVNALPVPSGLASVNRFLSYSKELIKYGVDVEVLSVSTPLGIAKGEVDGIKFNHLNNSSIQGDRSILTLFKTLKQLNQTIKNGCFDDIILVTHNPFLIFSLYLICKKHRVKFIKETSEYPLIITRGSRLKQIFSKLVFVNLIPKLYDGMLIMTKPLIEFYRPRVSKKCEFFEMPMTVDASRFDIEKSDNPYGDYIAYCGNMSGNKDGVENLIESFSFIEKKYPNLSLLLIGGADSDEEFEKIRGIANKLGVVRIHFCGKVSREEMPKLLKNAKLLALARPDNIQARYGFPTKLGEYLATGNPVVITSTGDIPRFLNDTNSYIVKPDDNKLFAQTLSMALDNYEEAQKRGKKGKELMDNVFNASIYGKSFADFLRSISNK